MAAVYFLVGFVLMCGLLPLCKNDTPGALQRDRCLKCFANGGGDSSCGEISSDGKYARAETAIPSLRVALFSNLPNGALVKQVIRGRWAEHSRVPIEFVEWDGYSNDPPADVDVFEFDAISLEYFVRNNLIAAIPPHAVQRQDDIFDFAWNGAMSNGVLYGVPHWLRGYVLFYRASDVDVKKAGGLEDLHQALGHGPAVVPPRPNVGLLMDLSRGTDCACLYLDAVEDSTGHYAVRPNLPAASALDPDGLHYLRLLGKMTGKSQGILKGDSLAQRAEWFGQGLGRVFVGYSERLAYMPTSAHVNIRARTLPMAERNKINLEFMNLATSTNTILSALLPASIGKSSQYLLPARRSVFDAPQLRIQAPLYDELAKLVAPETNPLVFRLGEDGRQWLKDNKSQIRALVFETAAPKAK
jgi:thiamine pyridinylase